MFLKTGLNLFKHYKRLENRLGLNSAKYFSNFNSSNGENSVKDALIFGIETSCDDTGCAIVDSKGNILGEAVNSQQLVHLRNGGIIPPIAQELHRQYMEPVAQETLEKANIKMEDIDAIAVTVKPGLSLSLIVGLKYAKYLCMKYEKPIIPIHHMEAHALMARMEHEISFPFLTLLISGGHCLLAVVEDVDKFLLLGESIDDAPGEAFDKAARRMKLRNIEEFSRMSGGQAIEIAAQRADNLEKYIFPPIMTYHRDCNFSFSGHKNMVLHYLLSEESKLGIGPDEVIPDVYNLCASLQLSVAKHICQRTQRAMEYIELCGLLPDIKTLVVSGGVASNDFIFKALDVICSELNYKLFRPRRQLCVDNGIMIAWNGMERWKRGIGITRNLDEVDFESTCPLGKSLIADVTNKQIKCKWIKLGNLYS